MTDSRKLTDNEFEQVAGGYGPDDFPIGSFVRDTIYDNVPAEVVLEITAVSELSATATMYIHYTNPEKIETIPNMTVSFSTAIPLTIVPDWVPAN